MRIIAITAAATFFAASLASAAPVQAGNPSPTRRLAAHANITVENSSSLPELVTGTNVPPFQLLPHRQAELTMRAFPPVALAPGRSVPVRFHYSIGESPGPQCRGTIDIMLARRGTIANGEETTHCVARSLGTGGARCKIAVQARNSACEGGLAFFAP